MQLLDARSIIAIYCGLASDLIQLVLRSATFRTGGYRSSSATLKRRRCRMNWNAEYHKWCGARCAFRRGAPGVRLDAVRKLCVVVQRACQGGPLRASRGPSRQWCDPVLNRITPCNRIPDWPLVRWSVPAPPTPPWRLHRDAFSATRKGAFALPFHGPSHRPKSCRALSSFAF